MNSLYMIANYMLVVGLILLFIGFVKDFKGLNILQKTAIILVLIGGCLPYVLSLIIYF